MRAISASNGASAYATPDSGYADIAPTAVNAALTTTDMTPSAPVIPTVVDPNVTAGETEVFTFTIATQPANGSASVVGNALVYTPAPGFSGTDSFQVTVIDKGGATVTGTAAVTVVVPRRR